MSKTAYPVEVRLISGPSATRWIDLERFISARIYARSERRDPREYLYSIGYTSVSSSHQLLFEICGSNCLVWHYGNGCLCGLHDDEGLTSEETLASPDARAQMALFISLSKTPADVSIRAALRWPHFIAEEPLDSLWRKSGHSDIHGRMLINAFGLECPW